MLSFLFLRVAVVFHLRYVKYIFSLNLLFVFSGITGLHLVFTKIQMLTSRRVINLITLRQNVIPGSLLELKLREIKKIMQSLLSGHRARFYISPKHTFFFFFGPRKDLETTSNPFKFPLLSDSAKARAWSWRGNHKWPYWSVYWRRMCRVSN